jgi:nicotinate-nucleotide pyrophosphorylase (carboxylating)
VVVEDKFDILLYMTPTDFSTLLPQTNIQPIIRGWLNDDMPTFDVGGLVVGSAPKKAILYMKSPGVFAGKPFVDAVFDILDCKVTWEDIAVEGTYIDPPADEGKVALATVEGPANLLLRGERTALNTISRCSGVATACYLSSQKMKKMFPDWTGAVAGTRKTTPGAFRMVEKYGLIIGGCNTHRLDLSQMTMLKDNHIWSCDGDITKAVKLAKSAAGFSQKIEVECQSLEEALEAASAGADIVMLDNYTPEELKVDAKKIKESHPHVIIEASGGITYESMDKYVCDSVDIISRGDLTHGYSCLDYSLKIQK